MKQLEVLDFEVRWALLERIAASSHVRRAARLRDLILYLGRRSLKEDCGQLHEQEIGIEVFGRPEGYDTGTDNIVRTNASELRKRLKAYFDAEGLHETVIMEIPRGSYVPVFRFRGNGQQTVIEPCQSPVSNSSESLETPPDRLQRRWILAGAILATLIILALGSSCLALWMQNRGLQESVYPWRNEPVLASFWSAFLDTNQDADVVVPDTAFGLVQYMSGRRFSLTQYLNHSYIDQLQSPDLSPDLRSILTPFSSFDIVTLNSIKIADGIMALDPSNKKLHLYFSPEYIPAFMGRDNVILLGNTRSDPWMQLFENRLNFTTEDSSHALLDRAKGLLPVPLSIINRTPTAGEQVIYTQTGTVGYCTVAYLPKSGQNAKLLIIQGTSSAATQAAGFFLLREDQLSAFRKLLKVKTFPYFEVLLKTSQVPSTPFTATIEAYRTYPNLRIDYRLRAGKFCCD